MARRRHSTKQKKRIGAGMLRREVLMPISLIALVITVSAAGWYYRDHLPRLPEGGVAPVQRVLVEGPFERVTTTEVEDAVLPHLVGNFFTVDLDSIRAAAEALPWVARAQVMREWPDSVHIIVTEERPAWLWGDDALLNERAERFVTGLRSRPGDLPRLDGPSGSERQMAETYLRLDATLSNCAMRVTRVELDQRRAMRVTLEGGMLVHLGRQATEQRAGQFCEVVVAAVASRFNQVAYVDMRYTNGFAVGWRAPVMNTGQGG